MVYPDRAMHELSKALKRNIGRVGSFPAGGTHETTFESFGLRIIGPTLLAPEPSTQISGNWHVYPSLDDEKLELWSEFGDLQTHSDGLTYSMIGNAAYQTIQNNIAIPNRVGRSGSDELGGLLDYVISTDDAKLETVDGINLRPIFSNGFTLAIWIKLISTIGTTGEYSIIRKPGTFDLRYNRVGSQHRLRFLAYSGGSSSILDMITGNLDIDEGDWFAVLAHIPSSGTARLYINNVSRAQSSISTSVRANTTAKIETLAGTSFTGLHHHFARLAIWHGTLSSSERRAFAESPWLIRSALTGIAQSKTV